MKKSALFILGVALGVAAAKLLEKLEEWEIIDPDKLDLFGDDTIDDDEN